MDDVDHVWTHCQSMDAFGANAVLLEEKVGQFGEVGGISDR